MTSYFRLSAYIERNDLRVRLKVELDLRQGYHEYVSKEVTCKSRPR